MIAHFILRDFRTYKLYWILLILVSLAAFSGKVPAGYVSNFMWYVYLMFAMVPINNLTGSTWRSQHIMSRNYMLALPVKRNSLFLITQARAFIYWIPIVCLCTLWPLNSSVFESISGESYAIYVAIVFAGAFLFINDMIGLQLGIEKNNSYRTQWGRAVQWTKIMVNYFLGTIMLMLAVFNTLMSGARETNFSLDQLTSNSSILSSIFFIGLAIPPIFWLLLIVLLAGGRFFFTRKAWLGKV
jgi:hypothetical protein